MNKEHELYENHSVVTKSWAAIVPKIFWRLLFFIVFVPGVTFVWLGCVVWFISFGHLHLYKIPFKISDYIMDRIDGGK